MADEEHTPIDGHEEAEILAWRLRMLLEVGFTLPEAEQLLSQPHLDWHEAERLHRRGCPHHLIIRLLREED
jgi:hypothetical protein